MFGIVSFIGWLIVGAIIGWIAGKVWVGHGFGTLGNIVVGIVGSMIGGFLFGWLFGTEGFGGWITAILGAIVLIVIVGFVKR
ncbi:MAG: GlsB/YeaQ/YmgE family stress response membrane protein [Methanothrix sp.]|nr:MAG: GlsB/YeaQ/YmgE family stress response membrane protein [Methanothrix sp.]